MSEVSKTWVITQRSFKPTGVFYTETHVRKGRTYRWVRGSANAKRMTKAEALFILDTLDDGNLIIFNLADDMFDKKVTDWLKVCGR
jgi:hypothetical protein